MRMPQLHALLLEWGALTPLEASQKAVDIDPKATYNSVYSRLKYGEKVGAVEHFKDAHGKALYRANPDWQKANHAVKGGSKKAAARSTLVTLREGQGLSFAKCAEVLNVTPAAAHAMYQRIVKKRQEAPLSSEVEE